MPQTVLLASRKIKIPLYEAGRGPVSPRAAAYGLVGQAFQCSMLTHLPLIACTLLYVLYVEYKQHARCPHPVTALPAYTTSTSISPSSTSSTSTCQQPPHLLISSPHDKLTPTCIYIYMYCYRAEDISSGQRSAPLSDAALGSRREGEVGETRSLGPPPEAGLRVRLHESWSVIWRSWVVSCREKRRWAAVPCPLRGRPLSTLLDLMDMIQLIIFGAAEAWYPSFT
ncbi:hypothetical protein EDC01DRAFT_333687 [Geopyxis carbonaria]|nr:hypothetical protein EDC01DRAFT_333687 [Geopyxis carbonaria]